MKSSAETLFAPRNVFTSFTLTLRRYERFSRNIHRESFYYYFLRFVYEHYV